MHEKYRCCWLVVYVDLILTEGSSNKSEKSDIVVLKLEEHYAT